ncbi:XRE family transcriptional regulator, partial [Listeria monocytogenes]|nr:XRE family transcriptional regulator [Listeria monocytogenes]
KAKLASAVALMKARESAGLTQRELAELAAVPQSTIARIERGDNTSFETLSKLASALGKTLTVSLV